MTGRLAALLALIGCVMAQPDKITSLPGWYELAESPVYARRGVARLSGCAPNHRDRAHQNTEMVALPFQ